MYKCFIFIKISKNEKLPENKSMDKYIIKIHPKEFLVKEFKMNLMKEKNKHSKYLNLLKEFSEKNDIIKSSDLFREKNVTRILTMIMNRKIYCLKL